MKIERLLLSLLAHSVEQKIKTQKSVLKGAQNWKAHQSLEIAEFELPNT